MQELLERAVAECIAGLQHFEKQPRFVVSVDEVFELVAFHVAHLAVDIGGQPDFERQTFRALHCQALLSVVSVIMAASRMRAVDSRLITVPIGIFRISAASL